MIHSILLAEDNLEHCFFFKRALKEVTPEINLLEVHNGDELISLLEKFLPDLLFLDLNMPCKNGLQCIKEIRENKTYDSLPIVVFTFNSEDHTIQTVYGFGANLYMIKPDSYELLVSSLSAILSMRWDDAKTITAKYFKDDRYLPYAYDGLV
jgi:DNA-binding response OmpR family regulator